MDAICFVLGIKAKDLRGAQLKASHRVDSAVGFSGLTSWVGSIGGKLQTQQTWICSCKREQFVHAVFVVDIWHNSTIPFAFARFNSGSDLRRQQRPRTLGPCLRDCHLP